MKFCLDIISFEGYPSVITSYSIHYTKLYEDVTTLIGKSGEGKSVLLKHIIGLLRPDEGSVLFRGRPIEKMSRREWNAYLGQVSYMFQNNALFDSKTVYENVAMPLRKHGHLNKKQIRAKVMSRLEQTESYNFV